MENQNLPTIIKTAIQKQGIDLEKVNLILPTQTFGQVLGEYDVLAFEVVKVEKTDCYELTKGSGKNVLAKRGLMLISNALGLLWDPKTTTNLESSERKSRAKATGALKKPNGEWVVLSAEKTCDLDAIEEEQRLKQEDYADSGKIVRWNGKVPVKEPWDKHGGETGKQAHIDREVRKAVLPYWKFKDERAETGAKERVIRQIIALMENYTNAELDKPFALPKIMVDVSKMLNDPRVQQIALDRMTESVTSIFGKQPDLQIPDNGSVLSDNYTVEDDAPEQDTPTEDNTQKNDVPTTGDVWDDKDETEQDRKNAEALEELKTCREKYNAQLPDKAKARIDNVLQYENPDPKLISGLTDLFNEWLENMKKENEAEARGNGK